MVLNIHVYFKLPATVLASFKRMTIRFFFLLLMLQHSSTSVAQDSSHLQISLLTCTAGDELYSTFGHSAIRVIDSSSVSDIVFNYGTFNFDDPNFYTKFIRGKLLYYVSASPFDEFKAEYQSTNRGITEQILNLTADQKIAIAHFLYNNIKEENRYYLYDFFLDNCTTRLRDIIVGNKSNYLPLRAVLPEGTRFRQAIHACLDKNAKHWSKLGIDLLLGAPTDAVMTTAQTQFLPKTLMQALDSSNANHQLVKSSQALYPFTESEPSSTVFTPMVVFTLLLLSIVAIGFSSNKTAIAFLHGFDGLLFFAFGAFGCLFIFMWVGTDHPMVKNNFNLLWAWPTHALVAFFINSKKQWVKKYLGFTIIGLVLVLLSWSFLPQQMNNALIPVVALLIYRSVRRYLSI